VGKGGGGRRGEMDERGGWREWDWQKNGKVGDDGWKPAVLNFLFLPSRSHTNNQSGGRI